MAPPSPKRSCKDMSSGWPFLLSSRRDLTDQPALDTSSELVRRLEARPLLDATGNAWDHDDRPRPPEHPVRLERTVALHRQHARRVRRRSEALRLLLSRGKVSSNAAAGDRWRSAVA